MYIVQPPRLVALFFFPRKIVGIVWAWRTREKREEKLQEEEEERGGSE